MGKVKTIKTFFLRLIRKLLIKLGIIEVITIVVNDNLSKLSDFKIIAEGHGVLTKLVYAKGICHTNSEGRQYNAKGYISQIYINYLNYFDLN